jgi:hypothetical protein
MFVCVFCACVCFHVCIYVFCVPHMLAALMPLCKGSVQLLTVTLLGCAVWTYHNELNTRLIPATNWQCQARDGHIPKRGVNCKAPRQKAVELSTV